MGKAKLIAHSIPAAIVSKDSGTPKTLSSAVLLTDEETLDKWIDYNMLINEDKNCSAINPTYLKG
ncbi:hypothetical protein [Paenibacillus ehimensis]|uniref:Uncharacterized protein n=1 Tax=Paenibacillus ehimensis TaxID=79264 RepID=A0ABT8V8F9_9BACL|nr:hypothetical protein [Paenibacillus ehimensis]MDO3676547.1 hypothetical protein [Paenibacillus ehimensis]MEC0208131.1 hypothetical protein [Paenibacillus ehimensis]